MFSALLSDAPERTQAKVPEGQTKANGYDYPTRPALPSFELGIFTCHRQAAYARQEQENKACDLKPELVQHTPARGRARAASIHERIKCPAAAGLLGRYPRENADFPGSREAHHPFDFINVQRSFRGYNTTHGEQRHATL